MKRALLVGAGGMGRAWAKNLMAHDGVELVGWVDIRAGAAAAAISELGYENVRPFDDLHQGLNLDLDFVVDVTIPEAHHSVTLAALEAGFPVIGEKPMASTMEEAREMVAASEKAGKLYMVSQSRRYDGGIVAYRDLIQSSIGRVGILNADFYLGPHFGGFRAEMPSPLLLDMAIHTFDAARFISSSDPAKVYAEEFNPGWSWYAGDACANANFTMTNGLRFAYRGSWCAEGCQTSWEADWRAVGEFGTALWDGTSDPRAEVIEDSSGFHSTYRKIDLPKYDLAGGISGSLREFLLALETGQTPNGECHDNIKSLAMVFAAIKSAKMGAPIDVTGLY